MSQKCCNKNNLESSEIQLLSSRDVYHVDFKRQDRLKSLNRFSKDLVENILMYFSLFVFFNRFSRFILLLFSLTCCFSCFVYIVIFNNFHTFCILQSENYLLVFFMTSKRKSDRINVNIHENEIILYILVLIFFRKISIQVLMTNFF